MRGRVVHVVSVVVQRAGEDTRAVLQQRHAWDVFKVSLGVLGLKWSGTRARTSWGNRLIVALLMFFSIWTVERASCSRSSKWSNFEVFEVRNSTKYAVLS